MKPVVMGEVRRDLVVELPEDEPLPIEAWAKRMQVVGYYDNGMAWVLARLWLYGEAHYGLKGQALYRRLKELTNGVDIPTYGRCANVASTARRIPVELWERRELSFRHYEAVAQVEDEKEQAQLLDRAVDENLTSAQLKREIARAHPHTLHARVNHEKTAPEPQLSLTIGAAFEHATEEPKQAEVIPVSFGGADLVALIKAQITSAFCRQAELRLP